MQLHHVQVCIPLGGEERARRFYGDALGLTEVDKPEELRGRGGCWFRAYDDSGSVSAEIHVGVEEPFHPARKAHPALLVGAVAVLDALAERLAARGFEVDHSQRRTFPPYARLHCVDGHGNRVELLAVTDG